MMSKSLEKRNVSDLAILGADPCFTRPLHVGRPNVGNVDRFLSRVRDILDRRWLTNDGPNVQEFESRIAELVGARYCVAMSSGTIALEIASRAIGLLEEVIMPAFTFVATAHALMWQGTRPVFCDIEPLTHHIDPSAVEPLINHRTSGILAVHLWGRACDVDTLSAIAKRYGLPLMFDACHAFGVVSQGGRRVGTFGACEVFSFHATKYLNTLEGGAVVTDDPELAEKLRYMRNFGFCGEDCVEHLGTNGKMNEVAAAMGLTLLEERDELVAVNKSNYEAYLREIDGVCGLHVLRLPSDGDYNYQHVVAMIDEDEAGLKRDHVISVLRAENVLARRYFYPGCHRMKPYSAMHEYAGVRLPVTDDVAARVIVLPTCPQLSDEDIARIGTTLRLAAAAAPRIVGRLLESESTRC